MRRATLAVSTVVALFCAAGIWTVVREPIRRQDPPLVVNDVTQLNPVTVGSVIAPTTAAEIVDAVRGHPGPISIGGARHSMGGQMASSGGLHIDMRAFNKIVAFSPEARRITVQAGARWREIQERIDPADLSVAIMQSFSDFTVGGSLSANVHGRYVGNGPIILSVESMKVVLADGSLVEATPTQHSDIFNGVIGGYGGLGVITEATLSLTANVKVKREHLTMPVSAYREYFGTRVRESPAVFHNGDIYPDDYDAIHAVTYTRTDDPVTVPDRLIPENRSYRLNRFVYWIVSEWPFGNAIRRRVVDPLTYRGQPVTWRNYEASYDTAELEPASRARSTYVLQEYFVPPDRFHDFLPRMRDVFQRHRVNVMNVSVRHATPDPGSLLAWAKTEVFAFVVYYKQRTGPDARRAVEAWSRELIDTALDLGGSYYLAYQLNATDEQFYRAYPRAHEFLALKRRVDPTGKFRNRLWNRYYQR